MESTLCNRKIICELPVPLKIGKPNCPFCKYCVDIKKIKLVLILLKEINGKHSRRVIGPVFPRLSWLRSGQFAYELGNTGWNLFKRNIPSCFSFNKNSQKQLAYLQCVPSWPDVEKRITNSYDYTIKNQISHYNKVWIK